MKRGHRLRGRRTFAEVRARRVAAQSGPLRVHGAPNGLGVVRVGFAIPGAVGGAVRRNRLRRRLRAALGPRLHGASGMDLVVSALPAAADLPFAELDVHLRRCLDGVAARLLPQGGSVDGPQGRAVDDNGGRASPPPSARLHAAPSSP